MNNISPLPIWTTVSDLHAKTVVEREWLVDQWIPLGQPTLIYGDGGAGKSLIAKQLCACVATNREWFGLEIKAGKSLYLTAEDDSAEVHRRLRDITREMGLNFSDLKNMEFVSLAGQDALLAQMRSNSGGLQQTELMKNISAKIAHAKPKLVVIDTLADVFPADENQRSLARQFIGFFRKPAVEHNCAIVVLAHPSLSGIASGRGASGNTGWSNSVRSRLYLERTEGDHSNYRKLYLKKVNYSQSGKEIDLVWERGCFQHAVNRGVEVSRHETIVEDLFLKLLEDFTMNGIGVNSRSGSSYAPSKFSKHPDAQGVTKAAFKNAMDRLFSRGLIEDVKPEGARASRIARV